MTITSLYNPAELYLGSSIETARAHGPLKFKSAAKAIRFALEEAAPVSLRGAELKWNGRTLSGRDLKALYGQKDFPRSDRRRIGAMAD